MANKIKLELSEEDYEEYKRHDDYLKKMRELQQIVNKIEEDR